MKYTGTVELNALTIVPRFKKVVLSSAGRAAIALKTTKESKENVILIITAIIIILT